MKKFYLYLFLPSVLILLCLGAVSSRTPLLRAFLQTPLNGNNKAITNVSSLQVQGGITAGSFSAPFSVNGTTYTDRVEATNASALLLVGGGATLQLTSSTINGLMAAGGFVGVGSNLTDLNASELTGGTVPGGSLPLLTNSLGITIDGGGVAITTGIKGYITAPYSFTITQVTMLADQSGSVVIDVWKDTYANYPPTGADTITGAAKPTITTATKSQNSVLTGWTNLVTQGEVIGFNVDSADTIQRLTLTLLITHSP